MKNNTAILNAKSKTISFKFKYKYFTVDLTEGDLHDSWNAITTSDGIIYDVNFDWDLKPNLNIYRCGDEEQQYDDSSTIEISLVIGTKSDYFDLKFDEQLDCCFILFSAEKNLKKSSKSFNNIVDLKQNTDYIICIDSNGTTKTLY